MILILTQCFPSRLGGVESLVSNLALSLSKSEKIIVFADRHHIFYDAIFDNQHKDEILVRRVGGIKFFRRRRKIKEIKPFIESKKVKLVISDSWKSLELGIDYLNINKIPVICLAHGNELLSNNETKNKRIKNVLYKVNCIIANSIFTKNLVKNFTTTDLFVDVIHPGASDLRKIDEKKVLNIIGNPIVLTLARLEKRKGHKFIILSIKKLLSEFPNLQYVIAGDGSELQNLKKLVKLENLEKNIIFVGNINDAQKKYLFEKTNLMIMPTLDETKNCSIEGFGISYLEAAFFSIPSIASNIGGTPEAVIHNATGKIINSIDELYPSIRELLINEKQRLDFGQNAQKRAVAEFNWSFISKKYLSIINTLVNTN
jgi:phosphatidylinositol alpha-1,6-mannosyltransferase